MHSVSTDVKVVPVLQIATGSTSRTSFLVDTAGYYGCCFLVQFGVIDIDAVTTIDVQHSDAATDESTLSSGADVLGTSQTVAHDDDHEVRYIDIVRPTKRYLQLHVNKSVGDSTEGAVALLYGAGARPVVHAVGTGVGGGGGNVQGEQHVYPPSGTV